MATQPEPFKAGTKWGWRLRSTAGIEFTRPAAFASSAKALDNAKADTRLLMAGLGIQEPSTPPVPSDPPVDPRHAVIVETVQPDGRLTWHVTPDGFTASQRWISAPAPGPWGPALPSDTNDGSGTEFTNLAPSTTYTAALTDAAKGDEVRVTKTTGASATPVPVPPADGVRLRVAGISLQRDGKNITPIGFNIEGPGVTRPSSHDSAISLAPAAKKWGATIIRLNVAHQAGGWADLPAIVNAYTTLGIIVMVELHAGTGYWLTEDELRSFWTPTIRQLEANPLAMCNFWNECGSDYDASQTWLDRARFCMGLLNAEGATNMIGVFDEVSWGQASNDWSGARVRDAASAALTFGATLAAEFPGRTMVSPHFYDQWQAGDITGKMADYFDRAHAKGVALLVGEVGGPGYHNGRWIDFTTTFKAAVAAAPERRVGLIGWHGNSTEATPQNDEGFTFVADGDRSIDAAHFRSDDAMPDNLTEIGIAWWRLGHPLAA